jgi:hypothetical protein
MSLRLAHRKVIGNVGIPVNLGTTPHVSATFTMFPAGTASGRVVDSKGSPIQGVSVVALHDTFNEIGSRSQKAIASVKTNDIGEFRIGSLERGEYTFKVEPPSLNLNAEDKLYLPSYYPGVPDAANARIFSVESGSSIRLGDIVLDDPPQNKLQIRLRSEDGTDVRGQFAIRRSGQTNSMRLGFLSDSATTVSLPQGVYDVTITPAANSTVPKSTQRVVVRNGDTELQWNVPRSAKLTGKVVLKSRDVAQLSPVPRVQLQMVDATLPFGELVANGIPAGVVSRASDASGMFSFPSLAPGRYSTHAIGIPPGMYMAKILDSSGHDLLPDGIEVVESRGGAEVTVVLEELSARVEGTVKDEKGLPVPNAVIALLPDDRDQSHLTFTVISGADGSFKLRCPAGSFHAYAWTELDGAAYRNGEFMRNYDDRGQAIKLTVGQSPSVTLPVLNP